MKWIFAGVVGLSMVGCSAGHYDSCMDRCDLMTRGTNDQVIAHSDCVIACVDAYKAERWYDDPEGVGGAR